MSIRTLLLPAAVAIALGAPLPTAAQNSSSALAEVKAQFGGQWELVIYEGFPPAGGAVDQEYIGRLLYDENDNMTAVGMPIDLPARSREAGRNVQAGFAYWGSVSWDVPNGMVIHHVEGSPTRGNWPGSDNIRYYEFTDDGLLKLSLKNAEGRTTGTLTWRKIRSN